MKECEITDSQENVYADVKRLYMKKVCISIFIEMLVLGKDLLDEAF